MWEGGAGGFSKGADWLFVDLFGYWDWWCLEGEDVLGGRRVLVVMVGEVWWAIFWGLFVQRSEKVKRDEGVQMGVDGRAVLVLILKLK